MQLNSLEIEEICQELREKATGYSRTKTGVFFEAGRREGLKEAIEIIYRYLDKKRNK